jgi:hypothetical protein
MIWRSVFCVFFSKTSTITIASSSIRYMMRQILFSSRIRISWQRGAMLGIGRECGKPSKSPCCRRRKRKPASRRADSDMGGVLISPRRIISALPFIGGQHYIGFDIKARFNELTIKAFNYGVTLGFGAFFEKAMKAFVDEFTQIGVFEINRRTCLVAIDDAIAADTQSVKAREFAFERFGISGSGRGKGAEGAPNARFYIRREGEEPALNLFRGRNFRPQDRAPCI